MLMASLKISHKYKNHSFNSVLIHPTPTPFLNYLQLSERIFLMLLNMLASLSPKQNKQYALFSRLSKMVHVNRRRTKQNPGRTGSLEGFGLQISVSQAGVRVPSKRFEASRNFPDVCASKAASYHTAHSPPAQVNFLW